MKKSFLLIAALTLFICQELMAQSVVRSNKSYAIIDLGASQALLKQQFFVYSSEGKKVGLVEVTKIQKSQALTKILKGKADPGLKIEIAPVSVHNSAPSPLVASNPPAPVIEQAEANPLQSFRSPDSTSTESLSEGYSKESSHNMLAGILMGYSSNSMKIKSTPNSGSEDLTLTGSSMSYKAFLDYNLSRDFNFRFLAGKEPFSVKSESTGNSLCKGDCSIGFDYFSLEAHGQYNLTSESNRLWLGLGYAFLSASGSSTTVNNFDSEVKSSQIMSASLGYDIKLGASLVLPMAVEYGMFPSSEDFAANGIYFRLGLGQQF